MAERVEDLNLPNAVVTRIIKECLPDGVSVAKDARTAIARAASVFVLFLTSGANAAAQKSHRKTITANDIFITLENAEFQGFIDPLKDCLEDFKKSQQVRKQIAAARKKETEESKKQEEIREAEDGGGDAEVVEIIEEEEEEERTQAGEEEVEQSREEIS